MKNMASIISSHNKQILQPPTETYGCNCRDRESCPLDHKCKTPRIIYRADVSNDVDNETKFYYGLTDTTFKERYNNHKKSFKHEKYRYNTELSKYIWNLHEQNKIHTIVWSIVKKVYGKTRSDFCKLCLTEKYFILKALGDEKLLNKKSEFINKCRHQNRLLLKNVKDSND